MCPKRVKWIISLHVEDYVRLSVSCRQNMGVISQLPLQDRRTLRHVHLFPAEEVQGRVPGARIASFRATPLLCKLQRNVDPDLISDRASERARKFSRPDAIREKVLRK